MKVEQTVVDPACACGAPAELRGADAKTGADRYLCWTHARTAQGVVRCIMLAVERQNAAAEQKAAELARPEATASPRPPAA